MSLSRPARRAAPTFALLLVACGSAPEIRKPTPVIVTPVADDKTTAPQAYVSARLGAELSLLQGVFPPQEAEQYVLPFLEDHPDLFRGKVVFEIGTGSGLISLFAAKLGARKVICSDISETALACVRLNAEKLGYQDIIEPRLVPANDMSAYSVLREGERFDTLISNPPYSLDLDAAHNTALVDNGDLGFSIVRGLDAHLAEGGTAALFYATLFFHGAMEKYARWMGYDVRAHTAMGMAPWELEPLFNGYLARLLAAEKLPKDAFRFYKEELPFASVFDNRGPSALVGPPVPKEQAKVWRGFMTIRRAAKAKG
jgi:SAM-dependent methyltransferase